MNEKTITWRDVLDCKTHYGVIGRIAAAAQAAGYPYFAWNDRLYSVQIENQEVTWTDEGIVELMVEPYARLMAKVADKHRAHEKELDKRFRCAYEECIRQGYTDIAAILNPPRALDE